MGASNIVYCLPKKERTLQILVFYLGLFPETRIMKITFFMLLNLIYSGRTKLKVGLNLVFVILLMMTCDPHLEYVLMGVQRSL